MDIMLRMNILIQELLGKSIDKIFFEKNRKFSMKDCCMIGIQILDRLEFIHSKYIKKATLVAFFIHFF